MKKFITTFCLAAFCSLGSFAQSLAIVHEDKEFTSGDVVSTKVETSEWGSEIQGEFFLKNKTSETKEVNTTLKISGNKQWMYCFGGQCHMDTNFDIKTTMKPNEKADLMIHLEFETPCEDFESIGDFTAACTDNANDKISLRLILKYSSSGITSSVLKNDVKVIDNILYYDMDAVSTLSIYDLSGKEIQHSVLENKAGEIDLNNLKAGLYIYKINGGEQPVAGKFAIN